MEYTTSPVDKATQTNLLEYLAFLINSKFAEEEDKTETSFRNFDFQPNWSDLIGILMNDEQRRKLLLQFTYEIGNFIGMVRKTILLTWASVGAHGDLERFSKEAKFLKKVKKQADKIEELIKDGYVLWGSVLSKEIKQIPLRSRESKAMRKNTRVGSKYEEDIFVDSVVQLKQFDELKDIDWIDIRRQNIDKENRASRKVIQKVEKIFQNGETLDVSSYHVDDLDNLDFGNPNKFPDEIDNSSVHDFSITIDDDHPWDSDALVVRISDSLEQERVDSHSDSNDGDSSILSVEIIKNSQVSVIEDISDFENQGSKVRLLSLTPKKVFFPLSENIDTDIREPAGTIIEAIEESQFQEEGQSTGKICQESEISGQNGSSRRPDLLQPQITWQMNSSFNGDKVTEKEESERTINHNQNSPPHHSRSLRSLRSLPSRVMNRVRSDNCGSVEVKQEKKLKKMLNDMLRQRHSFTQEKCISLLEDESRATKTLLSQRIDTRKCSYEGCKYIMTDTRNPNFKTHWRNVHEKEVKNYHDGSIEVKMTLGEFLRERLKMFRCKPRF